MWGYLPNCYQDAKQLLGSIPPAGTTEKLL